MARAVPGKPKFQFSTGITVRLDRIGPLISLPIEQSIPQVEIPVQSVEVGPGVWRDVPNENDPAYLHAVAKRAQEVNLLVTDLVLECGIDPKSLDIDHEQLNRVRQQMRRRGVKLPEDESDELAWVKYCCIGDDSDLMRFMTAIKQYDQPTKEDIANAKETFRGNVQRDADIRADTSEERREL